jgi:nitroreductase
MDALTAIFSRRSVRHYCKEPVTAGTIEKLLRAAMAAPSACDLRPWQFIVINERRILDEIPSFHNNAAMLPEAPVAILVCGEPDVSRSWQQDCSAATQNILLAAHAMGLGAVWLGIYPRDKRVIPMRELLDIPESVVQMALVALGYPAEQKTPRDGFEADKVRFNRWGHDQALGKSSS